MSETITLTVQRYDPEADAAPFWQTYEVPYREDGVVLDALNHVKDTIDATLSFRWSCHMAICGSCGMMINGEPKLACHAFLRDYRGTTVSIAPLEHFPVERDLVIVLDEVMAKLAGVQPYLVSDRPKPLEEGEYRQTPAQLAAFLPLAQCIDCMLCYAACPQTVLSDGFLGPAALALAQRYNLDSRDQGIAVRARVLAGEDSLFQCSSVGACSAACPKGVDPAAAIQRAKLSASLAWLKALLPRGAKT
jgi:fumarate reductase iron-sulfur subunit